MSACLLPNHRRGLLGGGAAGGELEDADVAEVDLGSFGFEAEVAFAHGRLADAVDELAVDRELYGAIDADDIVGVPFAFAFATHLIGHAALAARVFGDGLEAVGPEELAGDVAGVIGLSVFAGMQ